MAQHESNRGTRIHSFLEESKSFAALAVVAAIAFTLSVAGCHTVEGAGRDIQAIGGGVEDTADEVRLYE